MDRNEWRKERLALLLIVVLAAFALSSLLIAFNYYCTLGVLPDGRKIVVKLMDLPGKQGEEEFKIGVNVVKFNEY